MFTFGVEKERQRQAEKARKEDERRRDERRKMESKNKKMNQLDSSAEETFKDDSVAKQEFTTTAAPKPRQPVGDKIKAKSVKEEVVKKDKLKEKKVKEDLPPYVDAQAVQHMQDRPKVAHAQNHQIAHNEAVMT